MADDLDSEIAKMFAMIRADPTDGHAHEIGRMCVLWGQLEVALSSLLRALMAVDDPTTINVLLGVLDLRSKIQCILPIGFSKRPSDDWFARLQKEMNVIDNDLRLERNRTVHDHWMDMPGSGVHRVQIVGRVVNDQREKKLTLANFKPVSIADLKTLQVRIGMAIGNVSILTDEYEQPASPRKSGQQALPDGLGPDQTTNEE